MPSNFGWVLILVRLVPALVGLLWPMGGAAWIGRLPGDIRIEDENSRFYFPITTCIVISLAGRLTMWLFRMYLRP